MCDPTALLDLVPGEGLLKRPSMDYNEYTYCYGAHRGSGDFSSFHDFFFRFVFGEDDVAIARFSGVFVVRSCDAEGIRLSIVGSLGKSVAR